MTYLKHVSITISYTIGLIIGYIKGIYLSIRYGIPYMRKNPNASKEEFQVYILTLAASK